MIVNRGDNSKSRKIVHCQFFATSVSQQILHRRVTHRRMANMNSFFSTEQLLCIIPFLAVFLLAFGKLYSRRYCGSPVDGHGSAVLITGCDSGFGYELARSLDHKGFVVFAGCLFPQGMGAQSLARESSGNLKILKLDVTSNEDVQQAKKTVKENLPENGLWAVVNNAGISDWAEIEWSTIEDFRHMVDINLFGCIRMTVAFLPLVRAAKGRMVFVSSIFSFFNCLNMATYSVSKRGLEAFADCLRVEMDSFGVKVSIIQPGNFGQATNIVKMKTLSDIWNKFDDERKQVFNRDYIELAIEYFVYTCKMGFTNADKVIAAMLHALTAPHPKRRYLVVSAMDQVFFQLYPFLPTALTDSVFSVSSIYAKRKEMLYTK
ncbi:D-beta-hydroxybutyrate dehydrogenase, mitochondrial-like isoform X2 [Hippocampus comes]|uniref:D-beta-hydroxybutyrate dehydrogenase, mitochondrial-like isoform X2 n=1 Tax=Hippocampus comes TaxID=109280 RepID=UPI00094EDB8C|nr:PREDICTED: D-beta-hydroxybutyrate dehydrogenase, mitochondrial-like isoform X2 [Hippocampus comes]